MDALRNKHVVITGASSGIGEALAREMARAGAHLTLVARRRDRLEQLARECGTRAHVIERDLSDLEGAASWLSEAVAALGPIDILVNNAGVESIGPTVGIDPRDARRVLALNLEAPLLLSSAVLPGMQARGGVIVNVASVAALAPPPQFAWYAASKGGLAAFFGVALQRARTDPCPRAHSVSGARDDGAGRARLCGRRGANGNGRSDAGGLAGYPRQAHGGCHPPWQTATHLPEVLSSCVVVSLACPLAHGPRRAQVAPAHEPVVPTAWVGVSCRVARRGVRDGHA